MDDRRKSRHGYNPGEDEKVYEELKGNQHKLDHNKNGKLDAHDFKLLRGKKKVAEEAEELEELSQDKLMQYRSAAKKQGTGIQDKMKIGGGDWSKDGKDTSTLKKRMAGYKMAGRKVNPGLSASVGKAPRVAATEEVQIDETAKIVAHLQKRYGDNIRKSHVMSAANDFGVDASKLAKAVRTKLGKNMLGEKLNMDEGMERVVDDGKTPIGRATQHATKLISSHTKRKHYFDGGDLVDHETDKTVVHNAAGKTLYAVKKLAKEYHAGVKEEIEELDEKLNMDKASMGTVVKDFQKSDAPQFKGKSQDKRRAMAIAAKLTAERGGKPLRKEEKLADLLGDLTETHRRTMLSVFDKLNEDNQKKFLEACETPDGVESMLDFSISHRGE
jgi:hypothetical protein